jgi:hypothetical protein
MTLFVLLDNPEVLVLVLVVVEGAVAEEVATEMLYKKLMFQTRISISNHLMPSLTSRT